MIGKTISHYRVGEKLGGGGMGAVHRFEGTDVDDSHRVGNAWFAANRVPT